MRTVLRVLGVLLVLAVLAAGGAAWYGYSLVRPTGGPKVELEIKPGTSLANVAADLQARGVIRSADALRAVMRVQGTAGSLRDGLYDVSGEMSTLDVAGVLAKPGRPRLRYVTIPEGRRLKEVPALVEAAGLGKAADLRAALNDVKLSPYAKGSLEGFVFPATYPFRPEATPREIAEGMVKRMNDEFTPERVARAKALGLDVYGWVTLASMVQAEAANDQEMPVIAGVFLNRLEDGIALGSDPTVAYGLGKDLPELDRYAGDFTKDTPYNTYTRRGLPQGPINLPGQAALDSVLNARRTVDGKRALYFLHGLRGEFRVNPTYGAHLRDIARYR
ncbi:endolytic transglycosylase MltG [Deinococcus pimensis]|uniref:endolytic transglycosylase MltG n=1 Tax=Deinococcus pimensis TaxID=309888 RepID=UPI0004825531|nr:endolytic transglycosylase MltG [Deinococcus pimensis]